LSSRPQRGSVLGFDFGEQRIGIAIGHLELRISHPLTVIHTPDNQQRFAQIQTLIQEWQPVLFIIGVASHPDGQEHATGRLARRFGNRLHGRFGIPIEFIDERLTSVAAESSLRESGVSAQRRGAVLDAVAAAAILETWFETLSRTPVTEPTNPTA